MLFKFGWHPFYYTKTNNLLYSKNLKKVTPFLKIFYIVSSCFQTLNGNYFCNLKNFPLTFLIMSKLKEIIFHISVIIILNTVLVLIFQYYIPKGNSYNILKLLWKLILSFYALIILIKFDLFEKQYVKNKFALVASISATILFLSVYFIINSMSENNQELNFSQKHIFFLSTSLSVGLFEELLFRLLIFLTIYKLLYQERPKRLLYSIIVSSLIFAMVHFSNMLNPNYEKISVFVQVLSAFFLGLLLQCLFIKFRNIILIIILHGVFNYLGMYKSVLLPKVSDVDIPYTTSDLISSIISVLIISIVVVLPICYLLIVITVRNSN